MEGVKMIFIRKLAAIMAAAGAVIFVCATVINMAVAEEKPMPVFATGDQGVVTGRNIKVTVLNPEPVGKGLDAVGFGSTCYAQVGGMVTLVGYLAGRPFVAYTRDFGRAGAAACPQIAGAPVYFTISPEEFGEMKKALALKPAVQALLAGN